MIPMPLPKGTPISLHEGMEASLYGGNDGNMILGTKDKIERLEKRLDAAMALLQKCRVCPRHCGVDRTADERGECGMGRELVVSSDNLHHGEEPPLSGSRGSGTIFFTGCSLHCLFCQNYPISQLRHGETLEPQDLARRMLRLQTAGAHNINLVTPTHFVPQIMEALLFAYRGGLRIPLVYNSGGYESLTALRLLRGIVDIYLPDMKYGDSEAALHCSAAPDYPSINQTAIREMYLQVGDLVMDEEGIAVSGLIIRHLLLPEDLSATRRVLEFITREISPATYISFMSQYFPANQAVNIPPLHRRLSSREYRRARKWLDDYGLENGWIQSDPGR